MASDTSMPALLAYFTTALFNPNNISPEAAPFTSRLEVEVGRQICQILGFPDPCDENDPSLYWGHITSGGSVANMEAIWAARNLKFYPLSLVNAIAPDQPLDFIRDSFKVELCGQSGRRKLLKDCSTWELLNLEPNTILEIPYRLGREYDVAAEALTNIMRPFLVQTVGVRALERQFYGSERRMHFVAAATKHYSIPKGCALVGIGSDSLQNIPVDVSARMDVTALDSYLNGCLERQQAVYAVIAVMGSTDHGAVDPLADICRLRKNYQSRGMSFVIHADAAWGGYFASLLRSPAPDRPKPYLVSDQLVPERYLSDYVKKQFKALSEVDSVTVDPHKSGYIPFPAGGLCYRDGRMRYQLTWFNPSGHGSSDPDMNLSVFGMEGSKPGAAAAAAWISHLMLGLDRDGYGLLLAQAKFGGLKMYSHLATMDMDSQSLRVVPLVMLPTENANAGEEEIEAEKRQLIRRIRDQPNHKITPGDLEFASTFGSDLSINSFACNFRIGQQLNIDIAEANELNQRIYERLSITLPGDDVNTRPLIIMLTEVNQTAYGICAERLKQRLGLVGQQDLKILVNCVMSPFPTTSNFTEVIAKGFRNEAENVIRDVSLPRNTTSPSTFYFVMQGTERVYLVLLPLFHSENYRRQLIATCELKPDDLAKYKAARTNEPGKVFSLYNVDEMTLDEILIKGSFIANVRRGLPTKDERPEANHILVNASITNLKILKNHRLNSRYLDIVAPKSSLFYLYGTSQEIHIEHALVVDQNAQLTSDQVTLDLEFGSLSLENITRGLVVAFRDMHEQTFLPILPPLTPTSFAANRSHRILVFQDPTNANESGPGLFEGLLSSKPIAWGRLTLGDMTFADSRLINTDPSRVERKSTDTSNPIERSYQPEANNATHELYRKLARFEAWGAMANAIKEDYYESFKT
ncbi:hypothetical protein FRC07_008010 [Ceratobasidium sp. 392]|nr:hypothetical protein FRC07_008010 [Ceratobasidium sp. 392]